MGPTQLQPGGFDALFTLFPVLVVLVLVAEIGLTVHRFARMASRGQNPVTLREDLAAAVTRAPGPQRARTKAERLDELDSLRALGRITEEELVAARAKVLSESTRGRGPR